MITGVFGTLLMLIADVSAGKDSMSKVVTIAMMMVVFTIVMGLTAIIMKIYPRTKPYSKGVWIGGGIALLIGLGVCTSGI